MATNHSPAVSPREWGVFLFGAATLAFTAWGFAGVITWSLHVMLVGAALTFCCAVCPLPSVLNGCDGEHGNGKNVKRLLCFPGFWFGLLFLLYVLLQYMNPAAAVIEDERGWWVESVQVPLTTWLPTSVQSQYEPMNALRAFVLHLSAFLLACGLWVGLARRRVVQWVLWMLVLSGASMALVAILQKLSGADQVLWLVTSSNKDFWGSFFYRNQGGAYLNLIFVATGFLYFHFARRAHQEGRASGPHLFLLCLALLLMTSVGMALSRGAIFSGVLLLVAWLSLAVLQQIVFVWQDGGSIRGGLFAAGGVLLLAGLCLFQVDTQAIQKRFGTLEATVGSTGALQRVLMTEATLKMGNDRPLYGWGAGSFRYIFPMYQRDYPELFYRRHAKWGYFGRKVWRYAHNDMVQFFAEYGILGYSLQAGFVFSFFGYLLWYTSEDRIAVIFLIFGYLCAAGHATADFIFSSPAYWVAFIGCLAGASKLMYLEAKRA